MTKKPKTEVTPPLTIDTEFKSIMPPLTNEEKTLLSLNLQREGCLSPIVVWEHEDQLTIVDGYNRFEICEQYGLPHRLAKMTFADRDEAIRWILSHQLGRRNLPPAVRKTLIGRLYTASQPKRGRPTAEGAEGTKTAAEIAKEHNVSEATVHRAAKRVKAAKAVEKASPELANAILSGEASATDEEVAELAEAPQEVVEAAAKKVKAGRKKAVPEALAEREPGDDTEAIKAEKRKRRENGKEVAGPKQRREAKKAFGVVVRFIDSLPDKVSKDVETTYALNVIAAILDPDLSKPTKCEQ